MLILFYNTVIPGAGQVSASDSGMHSTLQMLVLELCHMRSAISDFTDKITDALDKISTLEIESASLRSDNISKDKQIKDLELKLDEAEQAVRTSTLILSGSSVNVATDDLHGNASKLLADTLKIDIAKASQFSYKKMKESANLMITVAKYDDRAAIFTAARTIKPTNFYVSEALTQRHQRLLYELRNAKRNKKIHSCFSSNGNIYFKKTSDGQRIKVESVSDIKNLIGTSASTTSSRLVAGISAGLMPRVLADFSRLPLGPENRRASTSE